jgi:hypothetical protein
MRVLGGKLLLEAWERGAAQNDLDRSLTLLSVAWPERSWDEVSDLSLAQVQRELLLLHRASFGDALRSYGSCPPCGARLELETQVDSLLSHEPTGSDHEVTWRHGTVVHSMRPATSRDLTALMLSPDPRARLLERCMEGAPVESCGGAECEAMAVEHFNRVNEGAEIRLTLHCPACTRSEQVDLDIGRFLWAEVRHAAVSLLREVHQLAAAYGWSESAILGMSSARRSIYLGMTAGE